MRKHNSFSAYLADNFDWDTLLDQYQREFDTHSRPFLLCDIFEMKENMHTNLLNQLLTYNNYMLLPSFAEKVLGIDDLSTKEFIESGDVYVTTQLKALGNKKDTWGLVDLVIGIGDTDMIIENKINGAVDVKNQLSRYVASMLFVRVTSPYNAAGQFDPDWYNTLDEAKKKIVDKKLQNLYVYYLTKHDSDEGPSQSCFSGIIKSKLETIGHFRKLSYENDLFQWLQTTVMPFIPQNDLLLSAIQQYVAYLKYLLESATDWQKEWVANNLHSICMDIPQYKLISNGIAYYKKKFDTPTINSLIKALEFAREDIFAHDMDDSEDGWRVHYTPSYIVLYKQSWTDGDGNKYESPVVQIVIHTPFHRINKRTKTIKASLAITHLSPVFMESRKQENIVTIADKLAYAFASKDNNPSAWDTHNRIYRVIYQTSFEIDWGLLLKDERVRIYNTIIDAFKEPINQIDLLLAKNNM